MGCWLYIYTNKGLSDDQRTRLEIAAPDLSGIAFDEREAGNISLDKFTGLLHRIDGMDSTNYLPNKTMDSLVVTKPGLWGDNQFRRAFYNNNSPAHWEKMYENLPVQVFTGQRFGFAARLNKVNGKSYVYLPYELLFSIINYDTSLVPPQYINSTRPVSNTISEAEAEDINAAKKGTLIQTEGIVWKHVSELISKTGTNSSNKADRLCFLWKHAYQNWVYINDPVTANHEDKWRSASETIETYYFNSARKYAGDCDDFAILVASFARQIGFESRFIGAFNKDGGHAYAEFFVPTGEYNETCQQLAAYFGKRASDIEAELGVGGYWINMDWWSGYLGGKYYPASVRKVYDL